MNIQRRSVQTFGSLCCTENRFNRETPLLKFGRAGVMPWCKICHTTHTYQWQEMLAELGVSQALLDALRRELHPGGESAAKGA